jgi:hypothetical protein
LESGKCSLSQTGETPVILVLVLVGCAVARLSKVEKGDGVARFDFGKSSYGPDEHEDEKRVSFFTESQLANEASPQTLEEASAGWWHGGT